MDSRTKPSIRRMLVDLDMDGCVFNQQYHAACQRDRTEIIEFTNSYFKNISLLYRSTFPQFINKLFAAFCYDLWIDLHRPQALTRKNLEDIFAYHIACETSEDFKKDPESINFLKSHMPTIYDKIISAVDALPHKRDSYVTLYNQSLFRYIVERARLTKVECITFISFSNRQSHDYERAGSFKGLSFKALHTIAAGVRGLTDIAVEVDESLLADIMGNKADGANMRAALANEKYDYDVYVYDKTKASIVICHAHKYAQDDLCHLIFDNEHEILITCDDFYKNHSDLLPASVGLEFLHYEGNEINPINLQTTDHVIHGDGIVDATYRDNLKLMLRYGGVKSSADYCLNISLANHIIYNNCIIEFKAERLRDSTTLIAGMNIYFNQMLKSCSKEQYDHFDKLILCLKNLVEKVIIQLPAPNACTMAKQVIKLLLWLKEPSYVYAQVNRDRYNFLENFAQTIKNKNVFFSSDNTDSPLYAYLKSSVNTFSFRTNHFYDDVLDLQKHLDQVNAGVLQQSQFAPCTNV